MAIPAVVAAVGTIAPKLFNAFKALGVRGKTQQLSWAEADAMVRPQANDLGIALAQTLSLEEQELVSREYPEFFIEFIVIGEGRNWWGGESRARVKAGVQAVLSQRYKGTSQIREVFWHHAMWVALEIDRARPDTFQEFLTASLNETLYKAGGGTAAPGTQGQRQLELSQKQVVTFAAIGAGALFLLPKLFGK